MLRFSNFCVDDDDNNLQQQTIEQITLPLVHARGVITVYMLMCGGIFQQTYI